MNELMKDTAICALATKKRLAYVRTLCNSIHEHHPDLTIFLLLVDKTDGFFDPGKEPFHLITLDELNNFHRPTQMFFKYTISKLCMTLKPFLCEHIFEKYKIQKLIYLDTDILVLDSLKGALNLLNYHSIVLTPHLTDPINCSYRFNEINILKAGVYNSGFIGLRNTLTARSLLAWWSERLCHQWIEDPDSEFHRDQIWIDLVPGFHDDVHVLRDPAYNIAYWNLQNRASALIYDKDKLLIDKKPVVFFHFSGLDPDNLESITKFPNNMSLTDLPHLKPLFQKYRDLLLANHLVETRNWPYAFGKYSNGVSISDMDRLKFWELGQSDLRYGDPFSTDGKNSFYAERNRNEIFKRYDVISFTKKILEIYLSRTDLQKAFPDPLGKNRLEFYYWIVNHGLFEYRSDILFQTLFKTSFLKHHPFLPKWLIVSRFIISLERKIFKPVRLIMNKIAQYLQENKINIKLNSTKKVACNSPLPFGVNYSGYLIGECGLGEAARASILALRKASIPTALNSITTGSHQNRDFSFSEVSSTNPYRINVINVNCEQVEEFRKMVGESYFQKRTNIGIWFWELSKFPQKWLNYCRFYHEIWVGSNFCRDSIGAHAPIPVVKMQFPINIDPNKLSKDRSWLQWPEDRFIFLFSFDFGSVFERKNPLAAITAFSRAFSPHQKDVMLVIKSSSSQFFPGKMAQMNQLAFNDSRIHFIDGVLTSIMIKNLINCCDCYISLHRSEGLGLGMAEAMYLEKPVIATGYSGNMDFMNGENSFLVKYKLVELQQDYHLYEKGNIWADPDIDHAAELMRYVYENKSLAAIKAKKASEDIRRDFSLEAAGQKMLERLQLLTGN